MKVKRRGYSFSGFFGYAGRTNFQSIKTILFSCCFSALLTGCGPHGVHWNPQAGPKGEGALERDNPQGIVTNEMLNKQREDHEKIARARLDLSRNTREIESFESLGAARVNLVGTAWTGSHGTRGVISFLADGKCDVYGGSTQVESSHRSEGSYQVKGNYARIRYDANYTGYDMFLRVDGDDMSGEVHFTLTYDFMVEPRFYSKQVQ